MTYTHDEQKLRNSNMEYLISLAFDTDDFDAENTLIAQALMDGEDTINSVVNEDIELLELEKVIDFSKDLSEDENFTPSDEILELISDNLDQFHDKSEEAYEYLIGDKDALIDLYTYEFLTVEQRDFYDKLNHLNIIDESDFLYLIKDDLQDDITKVDDNYYFNDLY